jgi:uncharacterized protein YutE (UPF0331/DUF86 family)
MNSKLIHALEEAQEFISETESIVIQDKLSFLSQKEKIYATSMTLFTVLNSIIEIGEEIITLEGFKSPQSYRNVFEILEEKNLISTGLSNFLKQSMKSRNMIAHQYGSFNKEEVYELSQNLDKFKEFVEVIKKYYKDKRK